MMRRKNLERAIVLGLLLSTSVYGSTWAETHKEPITDDFTNQNQNESFVVNSGDSSAIEIDGKTVNIITTNPDDGDITIDSNKYAIHLKTGGGSVFLHAAGKTVINGVMME